MTSEAHFGNKTCPRCSHSCSHHLIYDEPYIFHVRSVRSSSCTRPCRNCIETVKQQQQQRQSSSAMNIHFEKKGCSRLPLKLVDSRNRIRPQSVSSERISSDACNWDHFMKRKSRYAIPTPYASCDLMEFEQDFEVRPPFINYGGQYKHRNVGHQRTFNSLAVHQLKHAEANNERRICLFRERRLRQEAENYFREIERRKYVD